MNQSWRWGLALGLVSLAATLTGCLGSSTAVSTGVVSPLPGGTSKLDELGQDKALQASLIYARSLDKAGNVDGAIEQYEKVVRLNPNNLEASRRLAVLYDDRNDFSKAEAQYRKVAQARPRDADLFSDWGYSYYLRNNWKEAESKFRAALKLDNHNARARCNLGLALGQQGRYAEAFQAFREAGLEEADAHCDLAFVYWTQKGKLDDARRECLTARQLDPNCTRAKEMLAQLDQPSKPRRDGATSVPTSAGRAMDDRAARTASAKPITSEERHARYPLPKGWVPVGQSAPAVAQAVPQDAPVPEPSVTPRSEALPPQAATHDANERVMGTITIPE
jgi:Flp pilus assembly protein TadD